MSKGDVRCHKSSRSVYTVQPVLRMPRRATPTWRLPTSTSRNVSDQAFPVSKCSPPQLSHVSVNRVRGNEATVRTCTYAYNASDINGYAVHGMEQDSESERLRKRQATTPHLPVKTSRLLEARRCTLAWTRSYCSVLYT